MRLSETSMSGVLADCFSAPKLPERVVKNCVTTVLEATFSLHRVMRNDIASVSSSEALSKMSPLLTTLVEMYVKNWRVSSELFEERRGQEKGKRIAASRDIWKSWDVSTRQWMRPAKEREPVLGGFGEFTCDAYVHMCFFADRRCIWNHDQALILIQRRGL